MSFECVASITVQSTTGLTCDHFWQPEIVFLITFSGKVADHSKTLNTFNLIELSFKAIKCLLRNSFQIQTTGIDSSLLHIKLIGKPADGPVHRQSPVARPRPSPVVRLRCGRRISCRPADSPQNENFTDKDVPISSICCTCHVK